MLLRALQTTSTAANGRFDALTLVLVVVFIASMAALSFLLHRRDQRPSVDEPSSPVPPLPEPEPLPPLMSSPRPMQTEVKVAETSPVWLEGVRFPAVDANLSEAVRIIEGMLAARRDQQLLEGLRFYTPEFREQLRIELGIDDAELERTLAAADVRGAPPSLRSVEFVHASGASMSVRAGYSNGGSELYRFVRVEERWLVEGIERAAR